eukprot:CAMPEP_0114259758 /NCGR_PEP_ID=MMETSP0058-20121206/20072_1 /TAXON_ID=36894 /ORGANISM="Pyramimonas parkeae, CCMP726" /LENGTH=135 /DNA_ID=CAMNT_0001374843 /DNA_START=104 /DNA_END=511 /DNA_ORIENTATION=-
MTVHWWTNFSPISYASYHRWLRVMPGWMICCYTNGRGEAPSSSEGYAEVALQHVRAFLPAPDACLEGDDVVRLGPQGIVGREDHSLRIGAGEVGVVVDAPSQHEPRVTSLPHLEIMEADRLQGYWEGHTHGYRIL